MYVLGLEKNFISITLLEEKGYDIVFNKSKAFMKHVAIGKVKPIGVRLKNICKLEVDACVALSSKEKNS